MDIGGKGKAIVAGAVSLLMVLFLFSLPLIPEQVTKTDISYTPYSYEASRIRVIQATKFPWFNAQFPWIFGELTQAQYRVQNTDTQKGPFALDVTFDNGKQTNIRTANVVLDPGQSKVVQIDSFLHGKSTANATITVPNKVIINTHQETINVSVWQAFGIWPLNLLFR